MLVRIQRNWWQCIIKMVQPLWKILGEFLTKLKVHLAYNPAITFWVFTYLSEMKMYVHANTCIWMFIALLFIVAKY